MVVHPTPMILSAASTSCHVISDTCVGVTLGNLFTVAEFPCLFCDLILIMDFSALLNKK